MGSHVDMPHQTQLSLLKVTVTVLAIYISIQLQALCIVYIPGPYTARLLKVGRQKQSSGRGL